MRSLALIATSMRPRQWTKNVFVLAPVLFALQIGNAAALAGAFWACLLFCLASSSVYLFNDISDRGADATHPVKRFRPIASGDLSPGMAGRAAVVLALVSTGGALLVTPHLSAVLAIFLGNNLIYTRWGKHVPVLDVLMISFGFLLRVAGGAFAVDVPISWWIILCTFLLSLYLGLGKRIHELALVGSGNSSTRAVLARYNRRATMMVFGLAGVAAVGAFSAWALSPRALANFGTHNLVWTAPLAAIGILRFAWLANDGKRERPPTDALLTDPTIILAGLLWAILAGLIIYFPEFLQ